MCWSAIADEEAVNQTFSPFACQHRVDVVAHQRPAQQHGVRHNVGASSLLDTQRGDVESLLVLALDHVVRKHSVVAGDQFRDRVAEQRAAVERHIVLDERGLAVFLRHNEIARMAHGWGVVRRVETNSR